MQETEKDLIATGKGIALHLSIAAAKGLADILVTSFGPNTCNKIIVSKTGDIKLLKNASELLNEMEIQNPIAKLISKSILNQTNEISDGINFLVNIIGQFFKNMENLIGNEMHPLKTAETIDKCKKEICRFLISEKKEVEINETSLKKIILSVLEPEISRQCLESVVAVLIIGVSTIFKKGELLNLGMIEILQVETSTDIECNWIKGIVMDQGLRQTGVPKLVRNAIIMLCNISLEMEKPDTSMELSSNTIYSKEGIFLQERETLENRLNKIIHLKRKLCKGKVENFVIVNQKGIDSLSLERLAQEGIIAIRRAKRKNLERLSMLCNGIPINSFEEISPEVLGFAGLFYEQSIGEERFIFVENISNPFCGTIIIKGRSEFKRAQTERSIEKTLKILKLFLKDKSYLFGAGKIEYQIANYLLKYSKTFQGNERLVVEKLGEAFLFTHQKLCKCKLFNISKVSMLNILNHFSSHCLRYDCFSAKLRNIRIACDVISEILSIDNIILGKGLQ